MDKNKLAASVDYTLLRQDATWEQVRGLCDEAVQYATASVCIPPCFVAPAKEYVGDAMRVCTVVGFPNGYATTGAKACETREAVSLGADEIDMVINVGLVKEERYDELLEEIRRVRDAAGESVLKVIIECCLLTGPEKLRMCDIVTQSGADFIKTSTGFSTGGATRADVALLVGNVGPQVRVKAAGGIRTREDAEAYLALGASRLGISNLKAIL